MLLEGVSFPHSDQNPTVSRREVLKGIGVLLITPLLSLLSIKLLNIQGKGSMVFFNPGKENTDRGKVKEVFMTVHYNDVEHNLKSEEIKKRLLEIRDLGVDTIRFDFRLRDFHNLDDPYIKKTREMMRIANEVGLNLFPIISSPIKDSVTNQFQAPTKSDIEAVHSLFTDLGLKTPEKVQILNEWNNSVYTPAIMISSIPGIITNVKEVFGNDTKIYATLFLGKTFTQGITSLVGISDLKEFINTNIQLFKQVDILGIDYYPNTWEWSSKSFKNGLYNFLNISKLEECLLFVQTKLPEIKLDLGEIGAATFLYKPNERRQALLVLGILREIQTKILPKFPMESLGLYISESPSTGEGVFMDFGLVRGARDSLVRYLSKPKKSRVPLKTAIKLLKRGARGRPKKKQSAFKNRY